MDRTISSEPLESFTYQPQGDGTAVVHLRDNIGQDVYDNPDGEGTEFWYADEVVVTTALPEDEIEENFDRLWVQAETAGKSIEERIAEMEETQDAILSVLLGEE
ncbi:MAG: hypothetical protein J6D54_01625 [Olsenella sp.]|nr:hypothetical protein [Olsenella sp.]